jgi:aspartyl protease
MPQLTFPTRPDGLFVDVLVGLDAQMVTDRLAAGLPVPPAVQVRGLLDTGSDVTCVHASLLSHLGAALHAPTTTQTAGGSVRVNLFRMRVSICDARNPTGPLLMNPSLLVMEPQQSLPNAEVLIGLDILLNCKLFLDGPAGEFTLQW